MRPKKSFNDVFSETGYPALLNKLFKEEDVLIIPRIVTLNTRHFEDVASPRKSKFSRAGDTKRHTAVALNDSKTDDLITETQVQGPVLGVLYENPEDKDTPISVTCKHIFIEFALLNAISKSLKPYPNIKTLKVENCCMNKDLVESLAMILAVEPGRQILDLSLDGNEGVSQMFPLFVRFPTGVRYLSLQRCSLDDKAMQEFSEALSEDKEHKLQHLNLSMNKIGNEGVRFLAQALRTNRTLLSLSLAGNQIGDEGVLYLIEVLQKFELTFDEVKFRRKRIFDKILEKKKVIEKFREEVKTKEVESTGRRIRGPDGKIRCVSSRDRRQKSNQGRVNSGEKFKTKNRSGADENTVHSKWTPSEAKALMQQVESELPPDKHPFVNEIVGTEKALYCTGCWSLRSINLSYNYLTDFSLAKFADVFNYQKKNFGPNHGLLRLVIFPGNCFLENSEELHKLQSAMMHQSSKMDVPEVSTAPSTVGTQKTKNR